MCEEEALPLGAGGLERVAEAAGSLPARVRVPVVRALALGTRKADVAQSSSALRSPDAFMAKHIRKHPSPNGCPSTNIVPISQPQNNRSAVCIRTSSQRISSRMINGSPTTARTVARA